MRVPSGMPMIALMSTLLVPKDGFGITPESLLQSLNRAEELTLVDVRSTFDYTEAHMPGAINIPARLCELKQLPPIGRVVVYGDGVAHDDALEAVDCLNRKQGIRAELLDGGYPAWQELNLPDTKEPGISETRHRYLTYQDMVKAARASRDVVIVDLRDPEVAVAVAARAGTVKARRANTDAPARPGKTDLASRFPDARRLEARLDAKAGGKRHDLGKIVAERRSGKHPLFILIDDADGSSEELAGKLRATGVRRLAILMGGEETLRRSGQPGLRAISP